MNNLEFSISSKIYDTKAITNTAHKFSDKYYIQIEPKLNDSVQIRIQSKEDNTEKLDSLENAFINELLDQQIRISVEKDFGHIRDMIVKKAFSPING